MPIISVENWKPATKTDQVIQALVALINEPEPDHPLRGDLAEEYRKDKKKFMKNLLGNQSNVNTVVNQKVVQETTMIATFVGLAIMRFTDHLSRQH